MMPKPHYSHVNEASGEQRDACRPKDSDQAFHDFSLLRAVGFLNITVTSISNPATPKASRLTQQRIDLKGFTILHPLLNRPVLRLQIVLACRRRCDQSIQE